MRLPAHGFGGASDLPIPLEHALAGAATALVLSFAVLGLAWRRPRYDAATQGRPLPPRLAAALQSLAVTGAARGLGLVAAAYVAWAALAGPDLLTNPTFGVVYVLLWVGLVPASLLLGPVYRAVNPLRTLHLLLARLAGGDPSRGVLRLPGWVGLWPASVGLFAFVWLELVYPESTYLSPVRLWFAGYAAAVLLGAALFGDRWIAQADPFEAFSTLVGRLSVVGRRADGALVLRSPLANLDSVRPAPGLVAVVAVLFGSTAFDSFAESGTWVQATQASAVDRVVLDTLALLGFCVGVGVLFAGAAWLAGAVGRPGDPGNRHLPALLAHSLIPVVVGYFVAHYLTFFLDAGQRTVALLSDPMGTGADLLGTADLTPWNPFTQQQTLLAVVKVLAIVAGHVLATVAVHDRAVRLLPERHMMSGQVPVLGVMVVLTVTGLYLLLSA